MLYNQDFNLWLEQTYQAIKQKDFEAVDWDNLLEEIDDMGKSQKRSLESYLELLIAHTLKLQYWESEKERNCKHWQVEISNFRKRINRLIKKNPSLKGYAAEVYPELFADTVDTWRIEFHIPDDCFVPLEEILEKPKLSNH